MDIPEPENAKALNNLVTELFQQEITDGQKITIANPRYGFLLFRFRSDAPQDYTVLLDGKPLLTEKTPLQETIRALEPGLYNIELKGAKGDFHGETLFPTS